MGKNPVYEIIQDTPDLLLIEDVGDHSKHLTITNGAEQVVAELLPQLNGRRLVYIDSQDECAELLIENGRFAGFSLTGTYGDF